MASISKLIPPHWGASKTNTAIDANRGQNQHLRSMPTLVGLGPATKTQKVDPFADYYDSFNGRISLANKIRCTPMMTVPRIRADSANDRVCWQCQ